MLKIMISPAKKMRIDDDFPEEVSLPLLMEQTEQIMEYLQSLEPEALKEIWKCNDKLVQENTERLKNMNLRNRLTPAVISYEGIQYQTMAPGVMDQNLLEYLKNHLYILSGFYGILRAFDGVVPYRLEMQAKMKWQWKTLYEYWGDNLYRILARPGDTIINLASKEYSKAIEPWLTKEVSMITCVFGEQEEGSCGQKMPGVKVKATAAKMARGAMVRYMAENQVTAPEQIKNFDWMGYRYIENLSDSSVWVFAAEKKTKRKS